MRIGAHLPLTQPRPAVAAPSATTTTPLPEPVDQALLDAGREVALLPILDPAVCATVMMASVIGGMGGGAGLAAAAPTLKAVLDGRVAQVNYDFDRQGMDARGTVDERTVAETVRPVGSDRVRLFGRFGAVQENILVKLTDHGLRLTGKANGLEIDLQYSLGWQNRQVDQNPLPGQAQTWCDVRGTVGGLPYKAQASLAPSLERGDGLAQVLVEGQLGDQKINKSYALRTDPEIERVVMEGSGQVAGAEQSLRVELGLAAVGMEAFLAG
ncbi:MAG: hypothetical protein AMXMBFR33_02520 [Candidatus Xenobia bacterium]